MGRLTITDGAIRMPNEAATNVEAIGDRIRVEPNALLEMFKRYDMSDCLVLGWNEDGQMCFGNTFDDPAQLIYILETLKAELLK